MLQQYQQLKENLKEEEKLVLHVLRPLPGSKQAGNRWHERLVQLMESIGFEKSVIDQCLLKRHDQLGNTFCVIWVDDVLFAGPQGDLIEREMKNQ